MKKTFFLVAIVVLTVGALTCGRKVMVPPRIDLKQHEVVGIIRFECPSKGNLAPYTTKKFTEAIRRDQEMIRIIDLGTAEEVLDQIGFDRLSKAAFQAIGEEYDVATVFTGELLVSDVRPNISIGMIFRGMSVSAEVDATLDAQMVETETGASLWNTSVTKTREIGHVSIWEGGIFVFDAEDPDRAYGKLVNALVEGASRDFRVTWRRE
ncbi:MAG: hypothetical protein JSW49_00230 [candidate division WOR-3 bacterium]|nr:MAG: hypothetical protein JSW49_00230 [candidate division WOR-3 bacterium]